MSELKFATTKEALQYLSDLTGKKIKIGAAGDQSWKEEIVKFLLENPTPSDDKIHGWADEHNIEHEKVEEEIYILASKAAQIQLQGVSSKKGVTKNDVDLEELKMGIEVEKEHSDNIATREKIALDHLAEIPDYYTRLAKMEKEAH